MADKLTAQQAIAVSNRGGRLLVSAAAGSGKTKVLVDRLLSYLTDPIDPADLDQFLIITYTKAAASELRGKIAAKLSQCIAEQPENKHLQKQMQRIFLTKISTVHGFCGDLLREYAYRLDIPADFRVADENECRQIRETVLKDLLDRAYQASQQEDFRAFVDTQGLGRDDRLVPEIIEKVYDSARCHLDPKGWLDKCLRDVETERVFDASETVWGAFLIEELFSYLDDQILVFRQCVQLCDSTDGMEKVSANLHATLVQMQTLRSCTTWDAIVNARNLDYGRLTFPKKQTDPGLCEAVKAARNACKKGLEKKLSWFTDPSDQVLSDLSQAAAGTRGLVMLVRQFDETFSAAKKKRHVLDFGDLEHKTLDLLLGKSRSGITAAAREVADRYREIMVDEYQDSNGVQDAIFDALTQSRQNCFMVGDVKQSIYQFRLADPSIFLKKYEEYIPAEKATQGQGRKVFLSHNFRSSGEVIEGVNDVFHACMSPRVGGLRYGEAEALREGIPHEPLPDPAIELYGIEVREDTYAEEAAFVADRIQTMLQSGTLVRRDGQLKPVQPEDIVVLLRSPGSVGMQFQQALEKRGIRCTSGSGLDLLQTPEITTVRAFLQIIVNPRQDIPLVSTLASPLFCFTSDDLASLRAAKHSGTIYDALIRSDMPKAAQFLDILHVLRQEARMQSLTQLMELLYRLTRVDSIYAAMPGGDAKKSNLHTFYQLAADYESTSLRDLSQFLEHLDALDEKGVVSSGNGVDGSVTIMSIHKSKGLEYPVVFLCGLSREFNRDSLRAQILCDRELGLGLSVADLQTRIRYPSVAKRAIAAKMLSESISEELRVLYVAMTRARDRLVMTYAAKNLEGDLKDIALRLEFDQGALLCREVVCPGEWVLLAAVQRMEAAQFHALSGRPKKLHIPEYPWKICIAQAPEEVSSESCQEESLRKMPENALRQLEQSLSFRYAHIAAVSAPSKQTATGRKGRPKDSEAAENTEEPKMIRRSWRKPSFAGEQVDGKAYGNAMHSALQYIRYETCVDAASLSRELDRIVEAGYLRPSQRDLVNLEQLCHFFASPIGRKLSSGTEHLREFKFSILDDGSHYGEGLEGEQVLLQGVVDCALLEDDGITIVDFKTDRVTESTVADRLVLYRPQVETYAEALSRIFEMPVKAKYLYFFQLNQFYEL